MDDSHLYDITIIGAGPSGLFATFYAGLRSADVQLVESLPELGGQVAALFPEKIIYDVGGFTNINGTQLIEKLNQQTMHFKPVVKLNTEVQMINRDEDGYYTLTTNNGITRTKTIIIAVGKGAFTPRKLLADYDPAIENKKLFYYVSKNKLFENQVVAIAGGGDTAIDTALSLLPVAKEIHLIHRRESFRGFESSVTHLQQHPNVTMHTPYLIKKIDDDQQLTLHLNKMRSDEQTTLKVDKVIIGYGFVADNRILRKWNIELQHNEVIVNQKMETNLPGIYAIGDAVTYPGKMQLIATGFGEAPIAVNEALEYLYPHQKHRIHSTDLYH